MSCCASSSENQIKIVGVFYIFKIHDFWHPVAGWSECSNPMFDEGQLFGMHKWAVITLWKSDKGCGSYSKSNMQFWATSSALIRVLNCNSDNSKLFCMNKWASLRIFIKIRRKLWELFYIFKIHDFGYSVARRSECSNFNYDNSCYSTCKIELLCQFLRKSKKKWGRN